MWGLTTSDKMFLVLELRIGKFFIIIIAPYAWISGQELPCKFGQNLTPKSWKNIRFFEICTVYIMMFPCVSIDIWKSARTKFLKFALYHELAGSSNPVIWSKSDMDIFLLQPKIPFYLLQSIPQFPHIRPTCVCHHYKSHDYPMGPSIKVVRKIWLIFDPPPPCLQNLAFNRQN